MLELLWAIVLGVVEGVTEFLPISSTGHLLLCQRWMGIDLENDPFWRLFAIFIQVGAILAVVVYFRARLWALVRTTRAPRRGQALSPLWLVLLATVPALVVGKLADEWVDAHMGTPLVIALALGIGGVLMILIEKFRPAARIERMEQMSLGQGLFVGCAQVLAILFPGTSRSAATIMGGLAAGMSRHAAAEFSFFLAIPAMFAASGYKLLTTKAPLNGHNTLLLTIGTLVSFLVAWGVIAGFMAFIRRNSFTPFAVYRIVLAAIVILVTR